MADFADQLADMLAASAGQLARDTPRQPSTAVPHSQVNLATVLMELHDYLPGFVARIVPGEIQDGDWASLALTLDIIAESCRRQDRRRVVVIDGKHGG